MCIKTCKQRGLRSSEFNWLIQRVVNIFEIIKSWDSRFYFWLKIKVPIVAFPLNTLKSQINKFNQILNAKSLGVMLRSILSMDCFVSCIKNLSSGVVCGSEVALSVRMYFVILKCENLPFCMWKLYPQIPAVLLRLIVQEFSNYFT